MSGALSSTLRELRTLFLMCRPDEPMDPETHEFIASALQTCSGLAEQIERLARSRVGQLSDHHFEDAKIVVFPVISRTTDLQTKGIDHDT